MERKSFLSSPSPLASLTAGGEYSVTSSCGGGDSQKVMADDDGLLAFVAAAGKGCTVDASLVKE